MRSSLGAGLALAVLVASCDARPKLETPEPSSPPGAVAVLAVDLHDPRGIAVDDAFVYYGDGGTLFRLAKGGGTPEKLVTVVPGFVITSVAPAGDAIFFGALGDGVYRLRPGNAPERIARAGNPAFVMADATQVFFWHGGVERIPRDAPANAAAADTFTSGLAAAMTIDATHVYSVENTRIFRQTKAGGEVQTLARTGGQYAALAVGDTHVYFADTDRGLVLRVPKAGGPVELVMHDAGRGVSIAADASGLYILEIDGHLHHVNPKDLRRRTLAVDATTTSNSNGARIALDGTHVYIGADDSRFSGGGLVHIDLTKPDPHIPDLTYYGKVVSIAKSATDPYLRAVEPPPAELELATVYFALGAVEAQDWNNATRWLDREPLTARDALVSGTVTLGVRGCAPAASAVELVRRRAEAVAARVREIVGDKARLVVTSAAGEGCSGDVIIGYPLDQIAALFAP